MATNAPSSSLPHINLLCMDERFIHAFKEARETFKLPSEVSVTIHDCALSLLPSSVTFDLIISPANSYGRLDGGFDDAISRAFSPRDEYLALTKVAQGVLYSEWRGFAPPGTCTLVRIPESFKVRSRNVWGTKFLALCPTMRTPQEVEWDREVVYEAIWSLMCAVDKHNMAVVEGKADGEARIESLLMTPMATGIGKVSAERWAGQLCLALKHFIDAQANPGKWSALQPAEIFDHCNEVVDTWTL